MASVNPITRKAENEIDLGWVGLSVGATPSTVICDGCKTTTVDALLFYRQCRPPTAVCGRCMHELLDYVESC